MQLAVHMENFASPMSEEYNLAGKLTNSKFFNSTTKCQIFTAKLDPVGIRIELSVKLYCQKIRSNCINDLHSTRSS